MTNITHNSDPRALTSHEFMQKQACINLIILELQGARSRNQSASIFRIRRGVGDLLCAGYSRAQTVDGLCCIAADATLSKAGKD